MLAAKGEAFESHDTTIGQRLLLRLLAATCQKNKTRAERDNQAQNPEHPEPSAL
jgi:hypothetical protein